MVCSPCKRRLEIETTGIYVIETRGPEHTNYKLWRADRYECPGCGARIVGGFGSGPQAQEGEDEKFERALVSGDVVVFDHEAPR